MSRFYSWATACAAVVLITCSQSVFSAKIIDLKGNKIIFPDDAL